MKYLIMIIFIVGCGQDHVVEKYPEQPLPAPNPTPTPTPSGTPDPGGTKLGYQQMQAQLVTYCQSCHASAQFMSGEAALKASKAKDYLWSRRMPPSNSPKALPDNVRTQMLSFFP
jgi:hypothetical protein